MTTNDHNCPYGIVLRDKTLNDIFNLDYGETAERTEIGVKWVRSKFSAMKNKYVVCFKGQEQGSLQP